MRNISQFTHLLESGIIQHPLSEGHVAERVVDLDIALVAVNWLCVSQLIHPSKQDQPRPKRYWSGPENIGQLTVVRSTAMHMNTVGDIVLLRDRSIQPIIDNLDTRETNGPYALSITSTRTKVVVMYQDGTTEEGAATNFEHCELDEDVDSVSLSLI